MIFHLPSHYLHHSAYQRIPREHNNTIKTCLNTQINPRWIKDGNAKSKKLEHISLRNNALILRLGIWQNPSINIFMLSTGACHIPQRRLALLPACLPGGNQREGLPGHQHPGSYVPWLPSHQGRSNLAGRQEVVTLVWWDPWAPARGDFKWSWCTGRESSPDPTALTCSQPFFLISAPEFARIPQCPGLPAMEMVMVKMTFPGSSLWTQDTTLLSPEVFFNFSTCFQLLNIVPLGLNQCPGVSITTFCSSSHSVWQGSKKEMHVFLWSFLPGEDNLIFNVL